MTGRGDKVGPPWKRLRVTLAQTRQALPAPAVRAPALPARRTLKAYPRTEGRQGCGC